MIKRKQVLQSIGQMSLTALRSSVGDLEKEAIKIKLGRAVQKGGKDVHAYFKKRKEIARTKTMAMIKEMKGEQNGQA